MAESQTGSRQQIERPTLTSSLSAPIMLPYVFEALTVVFSLLLGYYSDSRLSEIRDEFWSSSDK